MKTTKCLYIALCFYMSILAIRSDETEFIHSTRLGKIRGLRKTAFSHTLFEFKKIPYAKPPLAELRFAKPQTFEHWNKTVDGTSYGPNCVQDIFGNDKPLIPNLNLSEDCLHLNIFAPFNLNRTNRRSVMIWIHGGGFTNGQGMMFNGSKLAVLYDVIVVTINYRLNIFDFANFGSGIDRNMGLRDQQAAIFWVKNNIADYGGNSESITIFGESAGGYSVALQSVIPQNLHLFQRTIAESGSFSGIRDIVDGVEITKEVGRLLNCSDCAADTNKSSCVNCLRTKSWMDLFQAYNDGDRNLFNRFSIKASLGPSIDGDLIPNDPVEMLSNPNSKESQMFESVDFISGTNDCEAGLFYFSLLGEQKRLQFDLKKGVPSRVICDWFVDYIAKDIYRSCEHIKEQICKKYTPSTKNPSLLTQTQMAINTYTDLVFASLTTKDLDLHSRSRKGTYHYLFTHKPNWGLIKDRPGWLDCANHVDEIAFVQGLELWYSPDILIDDYEANLSSTMMSYWTNFAKTGNPNPSGTKEWPAYTKSNRQFIRFGEYRNWTVDGFYDRMAFWNEEIPNEVTQCSILTSNITSARPSTSNSLSTRSMASPNSVNQKDKNKASNNGLIEVLITILLAAFFQWLLI